MLPGKASIKTSSTFSVLLPALIWPRFELADALRRRPAGNPISHHVIGALVMVMRLYETVLNADLMKEYSSITKKMIVAAIIAVIFPVTESPAQTPRR